MVTSGAGCLRGGGTCAGRLWWLGMGGDGGAAGIAVARWWGGVGAAGRMCVFPLHEPLVVGEEADQLLQLWGGPAV